MFVGAITRHRWIVAGLALVMMVALALRLHGVNFGLPALNDPDELMFEMGSVRMLSRPTLNPGWFGHPATTTIYVLAVINTLVFVVGWVLGQWADVKTFADLIYIDPGICILPGRIAMVGFGIWSIWLTWRLARELGGEQVGLAAAAVMAVNPLHIAYSQVIRSDMMAVCFMLLLTLAALRIVRGGGRRDYVLASLWLGLAIVTKWPFGIAGLSVSGAYLLLIARHKMYVGGAVRALAGFGLLTIVFVLLASPYIVLDYPTLKMNLAGEAQEHHLGATGSGFLPNAWWYLSVPILNSLGGLGVVAAMVGAAILVRHHEALAIVVPPVIVFFVLFCIQRLIWERWALPLTPALSIAAGMGLVCFHTFLRKSLHSGLQRPIMAVVTLGVLVPQVVQANIDTRMRTNDTRQAAAKWVEAHVPEGATVLVEHFGFDLLQGPRQFLFPIGDAGCVNVRDVLGGKVQYDQIEEARSQRSNVDYGTLSPTKRETCGMGWAVLTQYDRYWEERARFPEQYAAYADLLRRGTVVASFKPEADKMGGPIVRIVRFDRAVSTQAGILPPLRK